eukprot:m.192989 g.192989  ORF g.192989 m.192989 type:complete len:83 (+) comp18613_c0_seq3:387-635(+)
MLKCCAQTFESQHELIRPGAQIPTTTVRLCIRVGSQAGGNLSAHRKRVRELKYSHKNNPKLVSECSTRLTKNRTTDDDTLVH